MVQFQVFRQAGSVQGMWPAALALFLAGIPAYGQAVLGRNLVVNGDAEAGQGITSNEDAQIKDVPGWTIAGTFTAAQYDGQNMLGSGDYGPTDRGAKYFIGGPGGGRSTAVQTIDLAAGAAEIDAGRVRFYLSGYLGNGTDVDTLGSSLKATFQDAAGATLLEFSGKGPTAKEMGHPGALLWRGGSGFLLPNTRKVVITIDLSVSQTGLFNYSAAENIALTLATEAVVGTELITNGNFEALFPDEEYGNAVPVIGWAGHSYLYQTTYDAEFYSGESVPPEGGRMLLMAQGFDPLQVAQVVDVTLAKERIDAGSVNYAVAAWLGGAVDPAMAAVNVTFQGASGNSLGTRRIGPVTSAERNGGRGMLARSATGPVPSGTRRIQVTVECTFNQDPAFTGVPYIDNVSLILSAGASSVTIKDGGIVNAASGLTGPVAPGEMLTIFTTGVSLTGVSRMQLDGAGNVAKELAGVKVFFDGTQAPLLYVSSSQIGAIAPFDLDGKSNTQVRVEYQGVKSNTVTIGVVKTSPAIFTQDASSKAGQIYNDNYQLNSSANAAAKGSTVTIFWTGGGQTNPGGVDGRMETGGMPKPVQAVTARIGGQTAEVFYYGAVPYSWAGLLMAEVKVPTAAAAGNTVPVQISVGGTNSPDGITMAVK